jgi:hypothetical protein
MGALTALAWLTYGEPDYFEFSEEIEKELSEAA